MICSFIQSRCSDIRLLSSRQHWLQKAFYMFRSIFVWIFKPTVFEQSAVKLSRLGPHQSKRNYWRQQQHQSSQLNKTVLRCLESRTTWAASTLHLTCVEAHTNDCSLYTLFHYFPCSALEEGYVLGMYWMCLVYIFWFALLGPGRVGLRVPWCWDTRAAVHTPTEISNTSCWVGGLHALFSSLSSLPIMVYLNKNQQGGLNVKLK